MATRASEIMTREVICVTPGMRATSARFVMRRERIRHLAVVDGGRLVGILSDRDLLAVEDPELTVDQTMTRAPITCSPTAKVGHLATLMIEEHIDALPIVSGEKLVGIVTSVDLMRLLTKSSERLSQVLPFDFSIRELHGPSLALPA